MKNTLKNSFKILNKNSFFYKKPFCTAGVVLFLFTGLISCGGGGSSGTSLGNLNFNVSALGTQNLSTAEVNDIVSRAAQAAADRGVVATIAVTDRVGNVLAVYQTNNAALNTTITSNSPGANGAGLDGFVVPSTLAAISKAITGAYLSSTGNAFSTRTASQIVQEFFQPGEIGQPSGPLYGVQFSQLPCSDLNVWLSQSATLGPKRSPLGLSADPGGFPIYENGRVVGGIGVIASANAATNGIYSLDQNLQDIENDVDEQIAFASLNTVFRAPEQIRANRITANGQTFQFSNSTPAVANPGNLATLGSFVQVAGYQNQANPIEGTAYGDAASGYVATVDPAFNGLNAYNLITNPADNTSVRFPAKSGSGGQLTQGEVQAILVEGMKIANRARAQIMAPLGAAAQVTVSVVDLSGEVVGLVRSADAPVFGTDVSVQKGRSALTFSSGTSETDLRNANAGVGNGYVNALNAFFTGKTNVIDGTVAFSARSIGNLHRPYFPDGQVGTGQGPLSSPRASWSPFNIGLQLDFVAPQILSTLTANTRAPGTFPPNDTLTCSDSALVPPARRLRHANGLQIFPGGFPIYKTIGGVETLVGAVGVSGDGVDQDDMIGYLGVLNAASTLGSRMSPYPKSGPNRADTLSRPVAGGNQFLKYVQCPQSPFNNSTEQNVCPAP